MFSFRVASVVALSALLVGMSGSAFAAPAETFGSGPTAGGTTVSGVLPGVVFTQVSAGINHSLAMGSDGNIYAWGYNSSGQLGNNSILNSSVPVLVSTPDGVTFTQVSAGADHSLAVGSDGNAYAWGRNTDGRLGNGTSTGSSVPLLVSAGAVPSGVTISQVMAGGFHSLAVGSNGDIYSWGYNRSGQLGDGTTLASSVPLKVSAGAVPAGVTFSQVSAGDRHSLAIGSNGKTYAWGEARGGQLGIGSISRTPAPALVSAPAGVSFTQVSAGDLHSLAVGSDGKAYAWGNNDSGQLGNATTTSSLAPVLVSPMGGLAVTQVSAGADHSLAIGADGNAYAWGLNVNGQLGNNTITTSTVPVMVTAPDGVTFTRIEAGGLHSLTAASDENTYTWGANSFGQLGNGTSDGSLVPVAISRFPVITEVSFGGVVGTELSQSNGSWTVVAPAHEPGVVDVIVSYTQFGFANARTTIDGFTFSEASNVAGADVLAETGSSTLLIAAGSTLVLLAFGVGLLVARGRRDRSTVK
ncbi:hypothetical protein A20C1_04101 [marine actinobacterium PHSC20C1]|nr:hypothetical protein A20C1_04101 [marine actinobacterium PHSC20C1]